MPSSTRKRRRSRSRMKGSRNLMNREGRSRTEKGLQIRLARALVKTLRITERVVQGRQIRHLLVTSGDKWSKCRFHPKLT